MAFSSPDKVQNFLQRKTDSYFLNFQTTELSRVKPIVETSCMDLRGRWVRTMPENHDKTFSLLFFSIYFFVTIVLALLFVLSLTCFSAFLSSSEYTRYPVRNLRPLKKQLWVQLTFTEQCSPWTWRSGLKGSWTPLGCYGSSGAFTGVHSAAAVLLESIFCTKKTLKATQMVKLEIYIDYTPNAKEWISLTFNSCCLMLI